MLQFLQRIGKALMLPIAALPAAALLLRLGQPDMLDIAFMAKAGDALFANLPLLFAVGVAIGFAKDGHGSAALAGAIGYLVLTEAMATIDDSLNMASFGGIITGIVAGTTYNRFKDVKLPEFLGFFSGRRLVPIMTSLFMLILAFVFGYVWEYCQMAIDGVGNWIVGLGAIGAGVFGFFNRLLIPFGLHHVLNNIFWFNLGEFNGATGDINRFFAGDPTAGIYQAGFFPIMMFALPAVTFAIIAAAKKERRKAVTGMMISLAFTSFLTGITEPIEFLFVFIAPALYGVHAVLTGLSLAVTNMFGVLHGFGFSAGFIDYALNWKLATKPALIIPIGLVFAAIYFVVFYYGIKKFNIPTPGREDEDEMSENTSVSLNDAELAGKYISALGGHNNIKNVDNCATRLRLTVGNADLVDEKALKAVGARGVMKLNKTSVQVIVGTNVEFVAEAIKSHIKTLA
ncbi:MAG: N-acetylglucosamine-specific PTS transporter subunit IIBC [Bacillaceae bacterium]